MKIAIGSATMADARYFPILDVLLVLVEARKHGISVDNLTEVFASPWFANKPKSDRELLQRSALVRSHDALLDKSMVFIDARVGSGGAVHFDRNETHLHPLDAISFLAIPFAVIVENEDYDGSFLFWMARAIEFDKFVEAYREGRFNFRHAGGKSGLVRSAKILSRGVWPRQDDRYSRAMRLWCCAVLDNDARFPGEEPNKDIVDTLTPYVSFGAAKPDILSVGDLLESISAGEMRIPRFQRPYVWSTDDMLQLFDSVFLGYRVPMTVMKSSSLDAAVTIFARVNQRGRDMTPDQMVSALTFRDREEGDFDLASSIDEILGELRGLGYGDLQRRTILQVVLAAAKLDFTRPSYEKIVDRTQYGTMRAAVTGGAASLRRAVQFLARDAGVKTSRLLPYASIAVMLSIYFDALGSKKLVPAQKQVLLRWFWATSFNGWYSGANTTDVRRAGDQMRELAKGGDAAKFLEFFDRPIRQFPETYDRRSARVRASLLVQILEGKPLDPRNGRQIDGFSVFADEAARDIPYFFPKQKRPVVSNPANRVILPEGFPRNARVEFLKATELNNAADVFASHFVDDEALEALQREDFECFVRLRENSILGVEKRFLKRHGLGFDLSAVRNNEEVDSDE